MRSILAGTVALLFFCSSPLSSAETSVSCGTQEVVVNVRDQKGQIVTGLLPGNFAATYRSQKMTIQSSSAETATGRVILMLDVSSSIGSSTHTWEIARVVANDLLTKSTARVALIIFATEIVETLDFKATRTQILEQINHYQYGEKLVPAEKRKTAFYDALLYASRFLGKPQLGDAIFAITDGDDNRSKATRDQVAQEFLHRGIRFFGFYLADTFFPTDEIRDAVRAFHKLADQTGGAVLDLVNSTLASYDLSPKGRQRMSAQLSYLYDLISHYYRLNVAVPDSRGKNIRWDMQIVNDEGKEVKKLQLFYPDELMSCQNKAN